MSSPRVLITQQDIAKRIEQLGRDIRRDMGDQPVLLVAVLKGAAVFLADLLRAIDGPVTYDFVAISSYGSATKSSGVVRLLKDADEPLEGVNVVVVEDIVDTGLTLKYLLRLLSTRNPKSLNVCALLDKPARRQVEIRIDYCGFQIPDEFVVGYGLDYAEQYRNLPYIGALEDGQI